MEHWLYLLVSNPQTLFTALAAVATVAAVITSLYLANRKPKASLQIRIGIERHFTGVKGKPAKPMDSGYRLFITCTNVGQGSCFVERYGLRIGSEPDCAEVFIRIYKHHKLNCGERKVVWFDNRSEDLLNFNFNQEPSAHSVIGHILQACERKVSVLNHEAITLERQVKKYIQGFAETTIAVKKVKTLFDKNFFEQLTGFLKNDAYYDCFIKQTRPFYECKDNRITKTIQ